MEEDIATNSRSSNELVQSAKDDEVSASSDVEKLKCILKSISPQHALFLATSRLPIRNCSFEGVVSIPWLRVFDFDKTDYSRGFLGRVKQGIENCRDIAISTQNDRPKEILGSRTDWIFMNGNQNTQNPHFSQNMKAWCTKDKKIRFLRKLRETQVEFCEKKKLVPKWFILWYEDQQLGKEVLEKMLSTLLQAPEGEVVACVPKTSSQRDSFVKFFSEQNLKATLLDIPLSQTCEVMAEMDQVYWMYLPQECGKKLLIEQPSRYPDYIELLPVNRNYYKGKVGSEGQNFVRGKQITWEEIATGKVAIERKMEDIVVKNIEKKVKERQSGVLPVYHTPASGATTLARQVLWKLHTKYPCGVLRKHAVLNPENLAVLIDDISGQLQQRLVLLVDNESLSQFYEAYNRVITPPIVLNVKRIATEAKSHDHLLITDLVTETEADQLYSTFSKISPAGEKVLKTLRDDVVLHHHQRQLYEFGLAAFDHQFESVKNWVVGRLEPHTHVPYLKSLLVHLSILKYFGSTGLEGEELCKLLKIRSPLQDIPCANSFIVEDSSGMWKINHNRVAKEILEFYYGNPQSTANTAENSDLSYTVRVKVHEMFIDLIRLLGTKGQIDEQNTRLFVEILIQRESVLVQERGVWVKKKRLVSRALRHASECQQLEVFQELVSAFPNYSEFHAHLGKYLCKNQQFAKGYKEYERALELCTDETVGRSSILTQSCFGRIHHMCATSIRNNIRQSDKSDILDLANASCEHFSQAFKNIQKNKGIPLVDEIELRLTVVKHIVATQDTGACSNEFVEESMFRCNTLFETYMDLPDHETKKFHYRVVECQKEYQQLFPGTFHVL